MIYLLTANGLSPGGSSTVHIYTQTIHKTTQNKQYIEQHNNLRTTQQFEKNTTIWEQHNNLTHIITLIGYTFTELFPCEVCFNIQGEA